jgi:N utilization substance protein A
MMAQLLAAEGFETVEDIAFIATQDLALIEGFNEELAEELQARATDHLERAAAEMDEKRRALGVEDDVAALAALTPAMLVTLGENNVRNLEDLAGLVPDDLRGWFETKDGERVRMPGILDSFTLTPEAAEDIVMQARVAAGWIDPPASAEEEIVESGEGEALADPEEPS